MSAVARCASPRQKKTMSTTDSREGHRIAPVVLAIVGVGRA